MQVLHLTRDIPPGAKGGISTAVYGMVRAQRDKGLDSRVVSFDQWRPAASPGSSHAATARPETDSSYVWRVTDRPSATAVLQQAVEFGPELIHVHSDMLWCHAAHVRSEFGIPLVLTVHVAQAAQSAWRGLHTPTQSEQLQQQALRDADLVLVASPYWKSSIAKLCPDADARIRIAPLGVDDSERALTAARAPHWQRNTVLYVGRFADVKGTDTFVKALPPVLDAVPNVGAMICGGIPASAKAERRALARLQSYVPARLQNRVQWCGWLDAEAVSAAYAHAAVLCVPSVIETFGLTAIEGMLHGAPIVAHDIPAFRHLLAGDAEGPLGVLTPSLDPGVLARALVDILRAPHVAAPRAERAARHARLRWLWPHVIETTLATYRELCL